MRQLFTIMLVMLLVACEKADFSQLLEKNEEKGANVTFVVGVMSQSDFTENNNAHAVRSARQLSEVATVLNLAVFRGDEKVKTINQKSDDEGFGRVSLSLAEGDYRVVVVAHSGNGNATITSPEKIAFPNNKTTDTFSTCEEITVGGKETHNLYLSRQVAKVRFEMLGTLPENIARFKFYYTGGSSTLDAVSEVGCVNSKQTEYRDVESHESGQVYEIYTFPHETFDELKITITALDASGNTVKEHILEDVPVTPCRVTTYSTYYFSEPSSESGGDANALQVIVDDRWYGEDKFSF